MRNLFKPLRPFRIFIKDIKAHAKWRGLLGAIYYECRYLPVFKQFIDLKYWIIYRTINKFHIVNLHTKPGYSDVTERLIHANFCLLAEFVEKENPFETIDWDSDDAHKQAAKEIKHRNLFSYSYSKRAEKQLLRINCK